MIDLTQSVNFFLGSWGPQPEDTYDAPRPVPSLASSREEILLQRAAHLHKKGFHAEARRAEAQLKEVSR